MTAGELLLACLLDAVIGDPRWLPHPVRLMGQVIGWYELRIRSVVQTARGERAAGVLLAAGLPVVSYAVGWITIELVGALQAVVGAAATVVLAAMTVAARDLADHARAVGEALKAGSIEKAREAVAHIVGRDTAHLSEPDIVRATVETIAESTSDGVVAPLFYLTLGGAPLALAYKAVNTLDSMVGHREPRYQHLGWASARLDDVVNWLPARLTALLLVCAAWPVLWSGRAVQRSWFLLRRDGHRHPSPNSGWPEAAMAGALGVQLGGTNYYGGVQQERPRLGDPVEALALVHIDRALRLMKTAVVFALLLAATVLTL